MNKFFAIAILVLSVFAIGCNDGSVIGEDLLDNEQLNLDFDDSFILAGRTIKGDSVSTFRDGVITQTYLLGEITDPIFGYSSSDIYTGMSLRGFADFANSVLDSIVLEMEYDTIGFYGDTNAVMNFEVFRVVEDFLDADTLYSDQTFMTEPTPLGSITTRPSGTIKQTTQVRDLTLVDSFVTIEPRLRIRLDDAFGFELMNDTLTANNDTILEQHFKGLYIKATADNNNRMVAFNFNENAELNDGIASLIVYFTKDTDSGPDLRAYRYFLHPTTHSTFVNDPSGTIVEDAINDNSGNAEYLFIQNMAGVNAEINIPDLSHLDPQTHLINAAQLVLTVNEEESEFLTDQFPPSTRYIVSKYNSVSGDRVLIDDLLKPGLSVNDALALVDGNMRQVTTEDGSELKTVTFNIPDYIKNVIENEGEESTLVITPVGRQESARRIVFYGPNHPEFPAKLRIAYTIK